MLILYEKNHYHVLQTFYFTNEKYIMKQITLTVIDGLGTESLEYEKLIYDIFSKNKNIPLKDTLFLTSNHNYKNNDFIVKYINRVSLIDLNLLLFQKLNLFYTFEYLMTIHLDGYPINYDLWDDEYLDYDYIGAPWPPNMGWNDDKSLVGNGGFSIRSKKLYEETNLIQGYHDFFCRYGVNEDVFISSYYYLRGHLENKGIKFAPVELAKKFSVEIPISEDHNLNTSFGFHGKVHLENVKNHDKNKIQKIENVDTFPRAIN